MSRGIVDKPAFQHVLFWGAGFALNPPNAVRCASSSFPEIPRRLRELDSIKALLSVGRSADGTQDSANWTVLFKQVTNGIKCRRLPRLPLSTMMLAPSSCRYLASICGSIASECRPI